MSLTQLINKRTLIALFGATLLTACGGDKASTTSEPKAEPKSDTPTKVLRIATEGAFPPYNYTNKDGSLGGFDVDIGNAICDKMQVKCEIVAQDWDGIIPSLKVDKYDAIIAAMAVTAERREQLDFSEPYLSNPLVFVAKTDSAFDPTNQADIDNNIILTQRGTIAVTWLEKNHPKAKMQLQDTLNNSFLDVTAGRGAAVLVDKAAALTWLNTEGGQAFSIKGNDINIDDNMAVAVDKGKTELLAKINKALADMKADGTYDKIMEKNKFK